MERSCTLRPAGILNNKESFKGVKVGMVSVDRFLNPVAENILVSHLKSQVTHFWGSTAVLLKMPLFF